MTMHDEHSKMMAALNKIAELGDKSSSGELLDMRQTINTIWEIADDVLCEMGAAQ